MLHNMQRTTGSNIVQSNEPAECSDGHMQTRRIMRDGGDLVNIPLHQRLVGIAIPGSSTGDVEFEKGLEQRVRSATVEEANNTIVAAQTRQRMRLTDSDARSGCRRWLEVPRLTEPTLI